MVIQPADDPPYPLPARKPLPAPDLPGATTAAKQALSEIDWSRPTIVIWMAGTGEHGGEDEFREAVKQTWGGAASIVKVKYPASYDYRTSVSSGSEAFRQVLQGIAEHGGTGKYQVLVCGESQGAWVVGDTLSDPMMRAQVTRAALVGHPGIAVHHYHDSKDPGILEVNHRDDPITMSMSGNIDGFLDSIGALTHGKIWHLPTLLWFGVNNPLRLATFVKGTFAGLLFGSSGRPGSIVHDPHNYRDHMAETVQFLQLGHMNASTLGLVQHAISHAQALPSAVHAHARARRRRAVQSVR